MRGDGADKAMYFAVNMHGFCDDIAGDFPVRADSDLFGFYITLDGTVHVNMPVTDQVAEDMQFAGNDGGNRFPGNGIKDG